MSDFLLILILLALN